MLDAQHNHPTTQCIASISATVTFDDDDADAAANNGANDASAAAAADQEDADAEQRCALAEVRDHSIRLGLGGPAGHLDDGRLETPPPSPADYAVDAGDPMAAAAAAAAASAKPQAERTVGRFPPVERK